MLSRQFRGYNQLIFQCMLERLRFRGSTLPVPNCVLISLALPNMLILHGSGQVRMAVGPNEKVSCVR